MHNYSILYAEDDKTIRDNFIILLQDMFRDVYIADNGKDTLRLYIEKKPDILLLDIRMPVIDGLEVAKQIRKNDEKTPIIMLTGYADRDILLSAVNLKLEAYIMKPVDFAQFNEIVAKLIDKMNKKNILHIRKELIWDTKNKMLIHKDNIIKLTKKEQLIIELLIDNLNNFIENDNMIYHIWENELPDNSHDNKLIQLIYRINKKLQKYLGDDDKFIENSYTLGYRILQNIN
jgi:DNA-binding response OmpR family regulator